MVQLMTDADPNLKDNLQIVAMKGAAQTMMGRNTDAHATLSATGLENDANAALWRGLAEARISDWTGARHDLALAESVLGRYPLHWQTAARLARARTGLATGDLTAAQDGLNALSNNLTEEESGEAKLYDARLLAAQGHLNQAVASLRGVEQSPALRIAALATYTRVDLQLAANKIKYDEATETLEKLRYRWRGDDLELQTLRKLGSLYFARKRWREGLTTIRIAAVNFSNTDQGRQSQDDMRQAFVDLFLGGKADALAPVDALALYYDFLELTPIGSDGDEMIRRLADRLVAVDLLGPAAELLKHQVDNRLEGVAKAEVATRLAMIYLMDHKSKEALAAIRDTRQTRLPDDLNTERRQLEARALADNKQYEEAIDLLADDDSGSVRNLRAEVYWEAGNYPLAGSKIEELLGDRWQQPGALTDIERAQVMRASIAYSLAQRDADVDRIRAHFGTQMNSSPDAKEFAVVTEHLDRQGITFRDLAKRVATVDTLQSFMTDLRHQASVDAAKSAAAAAPKPAQTASN